MEEKKEITMVVYHPKSGLDSATKEDLKKLPGFVFTCIYKGADEKPRDIMICGYDDGKRIIVRGYEKKREQELLEPYAGCTKETVILIENEEEREGIQDMLKYRGYDWVVEFS